MPRIISRPARPAEIDAALAYARRLRARALRRAAHRLWHQALRRIGTVAVNRGRDIDSRTGCAYLMPVRGA